MDERSALGMLAAELPGAGDDAAVVDGLVLTTDMLHETTDFPDGTTRYTAGWRSVGASLSDVAAMGADATAAVAVYGAPAFEPDEIRAFVRGARDVCESVGAEYVGGDLDGHPEFTVTSSAVGRTDSPVYRSGATPGDVVCVTGVLGRTAAAVGEFERGNLDRANDLFQFPPRVAAGQFLRGRATSMMDSSDGLARSLHQLSESSECGFAIEWGRLPVAESVERLATSDRERREMATFFGEDFELVFTLPVDDFESVQASSPTPITKIGVATERSEGLTADGEPLPDRGFTHSSGG